MRDQAEHDVEFVYNMSLFFYNDSLLWGRGRIFNLMIKVVVFAAVLVFYGLFILPVSSFLLVDLCTS